MRRFASQRQKKYHILSLSIILGIIYIDRILIHLRIQHLKNGDKMGFMGIGVQELLLILLIVLILFGAKKVPELARGLGSGIREFKKAAREIGDGGGDSAKAASASEPATAGQTASPPLSTPTATDGAPANGTERS
jgi:sec-independent protein translocase protein TatA